MRRCYPTGENPAAENAELRAAMQQLLEEAIAGYPEDEKAPGSWWTPARFGGSAPTPEEAKRLDTRSSAARAAKRRAKAAEKKRLVDKLIHRHIALSPYLFVDKSVFPQVRPLVEVRRAQRGASKPGLPVDAG